MLDFKLYERLNTISKTLNKQYNREYAKDYALSQGNFAVFFDSNEIKEYIISELVQKLNVKESLDNKAYIKNGILFYDKHSFFCKQVSQYKRVLTIKNEEGVNLSLTKIADIPEIIENILKEYKPEYLI